MTTPHKYSQHPHHSRKIPVTHHFTSYQQRRSAASLHPVQPRSHNPKPQWFRMEMALASPSQDAPIKLHMEAGWRRMWCLHCSRWLSETGTSCLFYLIPPHTLNKRGQPVLLEAPLLSCLDHTEIGLLYCALQVPGNTSYCRKHQQAAFHTKSLQHVHSSTGCKDSLQSP